MTTTNRRIFVTLFGAAVLGGAFLGTGLAQAPAAASAPVVHIPRKAPEFVVKLPGGQDLLLSSYRGKVCAIEFLFTSCPHCQEASRVMSKLNTEYASRGFQPVGVAFNDMAMLLVPEFVNMFHVNYPVGVSAREQVLNFLEYNENTRLMVPAMVFIDRKGMVRNQTPLDPKTDYHTEANLRTIIEGLLKEPAGASSSTKKGGAAKRVATATAHH